jgi:hypothetical protein
LVGKVKTEEQLRKAGAEVLGASVLLGDVGYEVQPGFLAEANGAGALPDAPGRGAATDEAEVEKKRVEAEALARFLLENLS